MIVKLRESSFTALKRSVSAEDVTKIERKLLQTMEMITMKKKKIAIAERDKRERARGRGDEGGGEEEDCSGFLASSIITIYIFPGTWWGKIRNVAPSVPDNVPLLKTEVQALEELSRFLFMEAHELQNALERVYWSQTCQVRCCVLFYSVVE